MTDDRFEEFVRGAAQDYHRPPAAPREDMWAQIQAARQARRETWQRRPVVWARWGLAAAAVLALGVALGRISVRPSSAPPVVSSVETGGADEAARSMAYQVAALQHLRQVETFLTVFRTEAGARPVASAPAAARNLLVGTRLLMDSPAARDQRVAALLQDIELLLAEIAHFTGADDREELDLIRQGMERRGVLLRLRSAVPEGLSAATAQGVL